MKWDEVAQEITAAFGTVIAEVDGSRVLVPESPFDFQAALRRAAEPDDREKEWEFFDPLQDGVGFEKDGEWADPVATRDLLDRQS